MSRGFIAVLSGPSWWTLQHTISVAVSLALIAIAAIIWVVLLRRRIRQQTALVKERLEREAALEERYRELFENASDIVYTQDLKGNYLSMNKAGERILGYTREEFLRMNESQILAPECLELTREMLQRKLAGSTSTTSEVEFLAKGGRRITAEVCARLIHEHGTNTGLHGIARDITEKKQIEKALRESEEHYKSVVEGSIQAIMILQHSRIQFANRATARILGYESPAALIGLDIWEAIVSSEDAETLRARTTACLEGSLISIHQSWRARRKDGSRIWVQSAANTIFWKDRPALLSFFIDVTERRQAEEALRRSEERFSKAFRSSPAPICITTLAEGEYVDVNESFFRLLGYSPNEIIGRTSLELGIWSDIRERGRLIQKLQKDRSIRDAEFKFKTKSGDVRTVLLSGELFDIGGELCILSTLHDITERQHLEAALLHTQKLEAVGQLAAGVAHDFNNIMTIIQGHANLLLSEGSASPGVTDSLKNISSAADRAANITRQLLTFSRKQMMRTSSIDLNEVIGNTVKTLQRLLGENIALQCNYSVLPHVMADSGMIEQAIVNLATNARDAMPQGGSLTISTSAQEVKETSGNPDARLGHFACLTVTDTGCGMDAQVLSKIYEPFFTTKEVGKGTGLGLSMVYGIVKQHHGWIDVTSAPGKGSTFRLFLPCSEKATPVQVLPPAPATGGRKERLLIVEDEPVLRELVCAVLGRNNYEIVSAGSGREALEIWKEHHGQFDLLLTDVKMPEGMSGKQLTDILRSEKPDLKVILASGYSAETMDTEALRNQGLHFLQKPFQPKKLMQLVRNCLDGHPVSIEGE